MTVFDAVMQGIIQGLTEFLPISSDGHLSIYQHFTGNYGESALIFTLMLLYIPGLSSPISTFPPFVKSNIPFSLSILTAECL